MSAIAWGTNASRNVVHAGTNQGGWTWVHYRPHARSLALPTQPEKAGFFGNYVNQWLKIKQQSAGYPSWVRTDEDKARSGREYHKHEGISLIPTIIQKNVGPKATAKPMLNSFWGKLGENLNKPTTLAGRYVMYGELLCPEYSKYNVLMLLGRT